MNTTQVEAWRHEITRPSLPEVHSRIRIPESSQFLRKIFSFAGPGFLVAVEGCMPSATGARVRLAENRITVTDGPFTESKEVIGGLAILKANSKEEAIQMARDFLNVAGDGECELRQLFEAPGA